MRVSLTCDVQSEENAEKRRNLQDRHHNALLKITNAEKGEKISYFYEQEEKK